VPAALVGADVFSQAALRRVAAEQRGSTALGCQLLELVVTDRAGVCQVEDPDFRLLAQPPGALAGLGEEDEVLGHLIPEHSVNNLEVEAFADAAVADDHHAVSALDRRDNRVLAVFSIHRVGQLPRIVYILGIKDTSPECYTLAMYLLH